MVTDDKNRLAGMLSMYDILLYLRPKHIQVWGSMEDMDSEGILEAAGERLKTIQVGDIMTSEVVTVTPEVDQLMVLDIMIKKHVRRLPVIDGDQLVGIIYISDLFNHLLERIGD
jgi:CBS domain-containing protein